MTTSSMMEMVADTLEGLNYTAHAQAARKAASELEALQRERDALQKENAELKAERDDWKSKHQQLKEDIDEELVRLASRAAHGFVLNAKRELDVLANSYIGHLCGFEAVVKERDSLRTQNAELRGLLPSARYLIAQIGTTGAERTDIIKLADEWLKALAAQPEEKQVPVGTDALYRSEAGLKSVAQQEEKEEK